MTIKSAKPLDVLTKETHCTSRNDEERFEGDFMLMTGKLAKMLANVVDTLRTRLLDAMESGGVVSVAASNGSRQILERSSVP